MRVSLPRYRMVVPMVLAAFFAWPFGGGALTARQADARSPTSPAADIRVRADGPYMLERYTTDGTKLQRYTGFDRISDIALYDASTVLVAEPNRNTISAMALDGGIMWTIPVRRPRCLQVLGPDRFLVCQDNPASVVEVDRAGTVHWEVSEPLVDAAGAVRLPDGNTGVVEGRGAHHAVHVISRDGKLLWTSTERLAQPRGLALLPTGELVTSGFDTQQLVIVHPFTSELRSIGFCCHPGKPSVTADGGFAAASAEQQVVRAWDENGVSAWDFKTPYPPYDVETLPDGTLLVSAYRSPDRQCLNAARAAERAKHPLAPYWLWLSVGIGLALLFSATLQWPALRTWRHPFRNLADHSDDMPTHQQRQSAIRTLSRLRRVEIGFYVLAATALVTLGALQPQWVASGMVGSWPYAGMVGLAGMFLVLLQYRTPVPPNDWTLRMTGLAPMPVPTWRMWTLWLLGFALVAATVAAVSSQQAPWIPGLWSAGLVLLAAGSIQPLRTPLRLRFSVLFGGALLFGAVLFLRLYRLEFYPPNLHLDMSQWSVQTLRLIDGDVSTLFTNGWAEIPMIGYVWSTLWTALGNRSLAACRFPSVVASMVSIVAIFFLVRRMYNTSTALISVVLLGVNHVFLHFSRIQAYMDPIPFHILSVLGLIAGLESGRYGWFALAGLTGGYSALTYYSGRVTPIILFALAGLALLRYPRTFLTRWPGFLLCGLLFSAVVAPQGYVYLFGRATLLGRVSQFAWFHQGAVDYEQLRHTVAAGLPRVLGSFWLHGDSSTQYGASWPVFTPLTAALIGMALVAALLRLQDIRGLWFLLWSFVILFLGGVLTIDPPFWPRIVSAFVPATVAAAAVAGWLCRAATLAAGRIGSGVALVAIVAFLGIVSWQQLHRYRDYCLGIRPGHSHSSVATEWVQSIMGRDIQRWGTDAMIYVVAENPMWHSCKHPTTAYYAYAVDAQDARDISQYLPFRDPRTIVCYFLPETASDISLVKNLYLDAEESAFYNNLEQHVFTRVVIPAPHR